MDGIVTTRYQYEQLVCISNYINLNEIIKQYLYCWVFCFCFFLRSHIKILTRGE